jgi:hypothetical protein
MAWARHGKCESDTAALCKSNGTHSKPLAARHGRGMAWPRHAVCESAFMLLLANVANFQVQRFISGSFGCVFNARVITMKSPLCD